MRPGIWPLFAGFFLSACGSTPEIMLIVDGDYEFAVYAKQATVTVSELDLGRTELALGQDHPKCLPFSLGIVPADGTANDAELTITIKIERLDGASVVRTVPAQFEPGLRVLRVHFEARCAFDDDCDRLEPQVSLPEADRAELSAEVSAQSCLPLPSFSACVAGGGCAALAGALAPICVTPCPEPSPVAPPAPPTPPAAPAPPQLSACPPGWSLLEPGDGPPNCEPLPLGAPACPPGESRWLGLNDCAPLGPACPRGTLPNPLPRNALTVLATSGPDLATVVAQAPDGAIVVLGKGTHRTPEVQIDRTITIQGACVQETVLQVARGNGFSVRSGALHLSELRIEGASTGVALAGGQATVERVQVVQPTYEGLRADNATLTVRNVSVLGSGGSGLRVEGSTLSVAGLEILGATSNGLRIARSRAEVEDLWVSGVTAGGDSGIGTGIGVSVRHQSQLSLGRTLVEGTADYGLYVREGSEAQVSDLRIRNGAPAASGGLRLTEASALTLDRVVLTGLRSAGLYANADSRLVARDLYVVDVAPASPGSLGAGLLCSSRASLELHRVRIEGAARYGLEASDCPITLHDLAIVNVGRADENVGYGLQLEGGSTVAQRLSIVHPKERAINLDTQARALLQDVTMTGGDAGAGTAVSVKDSANLTLGPAQIDGFRDGLISSSRSSTTPLVLSDLSLLNTRNRGISVSGKDGLLLEFGLERAHLKGIGGRALSVSLADATIADLKIEDSGHDEQEFSSGIAVFFLNSQIKGERFEIRNVDDAALDVEGSQAELSDVVAAGTSCRVRGLTCGLYAGTGLGVVLNANVYLLRFRLEDHQTYGVRHPDGQVRLEDGLIGGNAIGVLSNYEGDDLGRQLTRVLFRQNQQDIADYQP